MQAQLGQFAGRRLRVEGLIVHRFAPLLKERTLRDNQQSVSVNYQPLGRECRGRPAARRGGGAAELALGVVDDGAQSQLHAIAIDQLGDDLLEAGAVLAGASLGVGGADGLGLAGDDGI